MHSEDGNDICRKATLGCKRNALVSTHSAVNFPMKRKIGVSYENHDPGDVKRVRSILHTYELFS